MHTNACLYCQHAIHGRTDKKFCDDRCRNNFHNRKKAQESPYVRQVNKALRRNRKILQSMIEGKGNLCRQTRDRLMAEGFLFQHCTEIRPRADGRTSYFCYEFGYLPVNDKILQLLHHKPDRSRYEKR